MRSELHYIVLMFVATAMSVSIAHADVLELKNGGRIEGQIAESKDDDQSSYAITTADGVRMMIARSDVARVVPQTKDEEEYQRRACAAADTVDAHWDLAQWCRDKVFATLIASSLCKSSSSTRNTQKPGRRSGIKRSTGSGCCATTSWPRAAWCFTTASMLPASTSNS